MTTVHEDLVAVGAGGVARTAAEALVISEAAHALADQRTGARQTLLRQEANAYASAARRLGRRG